MSMYSTDWCLLAYWVGSPGARDGGWAIVKCEELVVP